MSEIRKLDWKEREEIDQEYGVRVVLAKLYRTVSEAYRNMPKNGFCVVRPDGQAVAVHVRVPNK